ncbi:cadherin domain-containing protein [Rubritalea halochordaticola]
MAFPQEAAATPLPDSLKLTVTVNGVQKTLNLHRRSIRGANFAVRVWDQTSGYSTLPTVPEVRTYRGTVEEDPNTLVCASINNSDVISAQFFDLSKGKGRSAWINEQVSAQLIAPVAADPMPSQSVAPPRNANSSVSLAGPKVPTGVSGTGISYGDLVEVEQAIDVTNHSYNNLLGNVDDILAKYELDMLVYDMMMTRDCLTRVVLPHIVIRSEQFYASSTTPGLSEMNTEWKSEPLLSTNWDMVWATEGYYAWGNQVGKDENSMAAGALYHETGHNWGVYHLPYAYDTMGGNRPLHEAYSVDVMLAKRAESIDEGDLTIAAGYSDPLHPHTHTDVARVVQNTPTDIDVLANDWDSNGDTLTIFSHTTTTANGGSVTLNPNGTLRYTPATNFVGKDMIVYTVQDDSTMQLKAREIVHIEVVNNGLMLHYAFDETSGTAVSDSSGVGLAGDLNGADFATHAVDSPLGKGIRVWGWENDNNEENADWSGVVVGNGSVLPVASIDDRGATPFDSTHNNHSGFYDVMDGDFTASTFFRVDDYNFDNGYTLSGAPWIFTKWWHAEQKCGWGLQATGNALVMYYRPFKGTESIRTVSGSYNFEAGKWYHTSVVFDRALNEIRLYVNGTEVAKQTSAFPADAPYLFTGRMPMRLGTFGAEKVCLDDFRLYSKALSVSEIGALVDAAGPTKFLSDATGQIQHYKPMVFDHNVAGDVWDGDGTGITYSKLSGDTWINVSSDGRLSGEAPGEGVYSVTVRVSNNEGDTDERQYQVTIVSKGVYYERFATSSATMSGLTDHASFPHMPTVGQVIDHAEIPANVANNYGSRMQAYLVPDTTGDYTFWVSGDDVGELWLSTSESPEDAVQIANLPSWTSAYAWDANPAQKSATITLEAGKKYYLMALHVEGGGGDHFAVAWEGPGFTRQLIPNNNLEIYYSDVVAKWAFDEGNGTTAGDGVPYGIDGALNPAVTWTSGKRGSAVSVANGAITLGRNDYSGEWTWSGWVKRTGAATSSALMASSSYQMRLEQYYNTHRVGYTRFGHADWSTGYTSPQGTWVYLSAVMDDGVFKVYENGVFQSSVAVTGGSLPMNAIGAGPVELDDVVIYNRAMTESELLPFSLKGGTYAVDENASVGASVASVAGKNIWGVALNYSITAGNTGGAFSINSSTGEITVAGALSGGSQYVLSVAVNDGSGLSSSATVTVNINEVNSAPSLSDDSASIAENSTAGASVITLSATDPDAGDVLSYAITAGNTNGAFAINSSTGEITVAGSLNYEVLNSYTLTVEVTDAGSLSDSANITVNVTDVDESAVTGVQAWEEAVHQGASFIHKRTAPLAGNATDTVDMSSISGDATYEFIVEAEDFGQSVVHLLDGNGWSLRFEQWSNSGKLGVTRYGVADYQLTAESGQSVASPYGAVHHIVYVVDSVNTQTRVYVDGVFVGTVSQIPALNAVSITLGATNLRSDASTGIHAFAAYNSALSAAEVSTHSAAWLGVAPASNNPPVATDSTFMIAEDATLGTSVGSVSATDPDTGDILSYAITAGNSGGEFAINSATGEITTAAALDYEAATQFVLTVEVSDGSLVDTATITVNVSNVNEAPVASDASGIVAEDASVGTSITTVTSTDPDAGDSVSYAITAGNTGGVFAINATTGEIITAAALDYETTSSYSLTVTATDGGGLSDTAVVTVTVTDVNEVATIATSNAETMIDGQVISGSMVDTQTSNNIYEVLQEAKSSGKPSTRVSSLEHTWSFDIGAGGILVELNVEAHHSANNEGDDFVFSYSTDGLNFTDLITVTKTADDNTAQIAPLPAGVTGTVYIRVRDTDRTVGNGGQDTINIDHLFMSIIE